MSNVSIYEKNWLDLVFEDKNKAYGAYQLRQENSRTTLFAFLGGILLLFTLIGLWAFLSSFGDESAFKPTDELGTIITLSDYHPPRTETSKPKTTLPQNHPTPVDPKPNLSHMVVAATPQVIDNVPKNDDFTTTQSTTPGVDTGINTPSTGSEGPTVTTTAPASGGNDPVLSATLDRLPEYPGGIKKFYEYVGNNIEKPEVDEHLSSLSVIMSFVIEKDGSMSSIKVLRSSDKNLETEAIRVLKSLKVKWSPGFKDGEKMRTLYTLPIKVAL